MKKLLYILLSLPAILLAQQNLPLNREWNLNADKYSNYIHKHKSGNDTVLTGKGDKATEVIVERSLSCFKPQIVTPVFAKKDKSKGGYIYRKLKKENFVIVNDTADNLHLTLDPILSVQLGKDFMDKTGERIYTNTRGFVLKGAIGSKVVFESSFYENQSTFPKYMDAYIASTNNLFPQTANYKYAVVPGQGRSKPFGKNGYDYALASGYVSYSPYKMLNIQVGNGKHFVGDGYRSLLLSDNAFNYPFARITTTFRNFQYTNLYTSFMNLTDGGVKTPPHSERLFQKKVGSFQMLNYTIADRVQLGLFQGMIWEAADSNNRQHVSFNTFDPVIGVNVLNYGMRNTNNILLGATMKVKFTKSISVYGQFMYDDAYSGTETGGKNKYGYQVGLKYFDLFTIKNLHLQFEYNAVSPYAYAANNPEQSYTHYNQSLAHPLGANFNEAIGFLNYRLKDFFVEIKGNFAVKGADSSSFNYGGNVFKSDNNFGVNQDVISTTLGQGLKTTILTEDIHFGYLVNPNTNFTIVLGITNRSETAGNVTNTMQFVYFGVRTSLANLYYDF